MTVTWKEAARALGWKVSAWIPGSTTSREPGDVIVMDDCVNFDDPPRVNLEEVVRFGELVGEPLVLEGGSIAGYDFLRVVRRVPL
jgi:hypothetical protein